MHAAGDTTGDAPAPAGLGLALIAAPGPAEELARALADELPARLGERIQPAVTWSVPVAVEPAAGEAGRRHHGVDRPRAGADDPRGLRPGGLPH